MTTLTQAGIALAETQARMEEVKKADAVTQAEFRAMLDAAEKGLMAELEKTQTNVSEAFDYLRSQLDGVGTARAAAIDAAIGIEPTNGATPPRMPKMSEAIKQ